ncbi:MAG: hypothetical protein AAF211_21585, partial [Myxococcota bacterium]
PTPAPPPSVPDLTEENARLTFENALLRLALQRHEGEPHAFPADYPDELAPVGFEATLRPLVEADEVLELYGVDCSEYPCIAWVEAEGASDADWAPHLASLKDRLETREGWGNHWIWTMPHVQRDVDVSHAAVGIMIHPGPVAEDVITRIRHRSEVGLEERMQAWAVPPE